MTGTVYIVMENYIDDVGVAAVCSTLEIAEREMKRINEEQQPSRYYEYWIDQHPIHQT